MQSTVTQVSCYLRDKNDNAHATKKGNGLEEKIRATCAFLIMTDQLYFLHKTFSLHTARQSYCDLSLP